MSNEKSQLCFQQSLDITLSKPDGILAVGERDWRRLIRTVKKCRPPTEWWSMAASFVLGICASAIIAIVTIPIDNTNSNNAVSQTLICVAIASGIIGVICILCHLSENKHYAARLENIAEVINDIEQTFDRKTTKSEEES